MRLGYQCRGCKGPPLPRDWEGLCPNCHRPYRAILVRLGDELEGAKLEPMEEGKPISPAAALMAARNSDAMMRTPTGLPGFDWILGGGFLQGKTVSFCGGAGAGKTSFLLKLGYSFEKRKILFLINSSEQSAEELVVQFERFGPLPQKYVLIVHETDRDKILRIVEKEQPQAFALDSIHDVEGVADEDGYPMASGGTRAIHSVAKDVRRLSRELGVFSLLVCHMNNDGSIRGGSDLRHEVDGTLRLDRPPEEDNPRRTLWFAKYRFAPPRRRARFLMLDNDFKDCGPLLDEGEKQEEPSRKSKPDLRLVDDDNEDGA